MLDDFLREEDETSSFLDEIEQTTTTELTPEPETGFLGMTPFQRFIVSLMFFLMVIIIGAFFLLVTGIIAIPIS
ncbi:MAG: hypothetical protein M1347_07925 [Chloroflexi bacterium]|nr:hypothetical protein [Chloroflexota bacterium]